MESAFEFFLTFNKQQRKKFGNQEFTQGVNSLTANRFKKSEIGSMWKQIANPNDPVIDLYQFRKNFDGLRYTGNSTIRNVTSAPPGARSTVFSQSSSSSTWNTDVFEKLRQIIRTSPKSFEDIFREMDSDGNGTVSSVEFRNAIRRLGLGLKSTEID